jgi:double-stranded uracil-DNA glycosylase
MQPYRPSSEEIRGAIGKSVPDVIAPGLRILFCGINPGLYSGAVGHHFARPGNRFWPTLHAAGFTPRLLSPFEEQELLRYGYGITNFVNRATASAAELSPGELEEGGRGLREKVLTYRPGCLAVLGVSAYRLAFRQPGAVLGRQPEALERAVVWVLPNPSGANAHYPPGELARLFGALRAAMTESLVPEPPGLASDQDP